MNNKFTNYNDWFTFTSGKLEAFVSIGGRVERLRHGRVMRAFQDAEDYIAARPKIASDLAEWKVARVKAISEWRHTTPHFRYDCDGGALAVRINGNATIKIGCGGDGNHPVYIVKGELPPFWSNSGISLEACTIEPLDYDCEGGKPLCSLEVKSAWFFRHEGAVAIAIEEAQA